MSDGDAGADAATHGPDADDIRLTGTPPGSRGAAPWERFGTTTQTVAVVNRWTGPSARREPGTLLCLPLASLLLKTRRYERN